ncbi:hypothetical protein MMC14_010090, partial [Varicellaria rhodocarpa]|nr:hypothetical protein [Varicellaria rhodocarpa]
MAKSSIILVPGAFLDPTTYNTLFELLLGAGHATKCAPLPSLSPTEPFQADCTTDAIFIHNNILLPLIEEEGNDVLLAMHSYGSIPGSAAAKGLGKTQRMRENRPGGIVGLVVVVGMIIAERSTPTRD